MKVFEPFLVFCRGVWSVIAGFFVNEYERIGGEFDRELHPLEEAFVRELLPELLKKK